MLAAVPRSSLKSNGGKSTGSAHDVTFRIDVTLKVARQGGGVKGMPEPGLFRMRESNVVYS